MGARQSAIPSGIVKLLNSHTSSSNFSAFSRSTKQNMTPTSSSAPLDESATGRLSGGVANGIHSVLDTMDRFLANNDGNYLVQLLINLEHKSNVSRNILARILLCMIVSYFIFSIKILDFASNGLLFFLPSYGTYILLQKEDVDRNELIDLSRYWMFAGFFATFDFALSAVIPFWSFIRIFLAIQCVLPRRSAIVDVLLNGVVTPIYRQLENNAQMNDVNEFLRRQRANSQRQQH